MNFYMMSPLLFLTSIILSTTLYPHILILLMSLEIIMITSIFMLFFTLMMINFEYFIMLMLIMFVCEGVLGLTLLILIIQFKGTDMGDSSQTVIFMSPSYISCMLKN